MVYFVTPAEVILLARFGGIVKFVLVFASWMTLSYMWSPSHLSQSVRAVIVWVAPLPLIRVVFIMMSVEMKNI